MFYYDHYSNTRKGSNSTRFNLSASHLSFKGRELNHFLKQKLGHSEVQRWESCCEDEIFSISDYKFGREQRHGLF